MHVQGRLTVIAMEIDTILGVRVYYGATIVLTD